MSKQQGNSNIADDAARARKLLDKHAPVKVSGLNKGNFTLQQGVNQNIGEHAVIVIISEQTVHQYTISHPIGVTDLDEKLDWVINSTEYVPSMISRKADPAIGAINQQRAQLRTQLAVDAGLLTSKKIDEKHVHFYPNRDDMSRNDLLQEARLQLKEDQIQLTNEIKKTEDKAEKAKLTQQLARLTDPTEYLDGVTAASEENLRKFWQSDEVQRVIEFEAPQLYRTLTGPYADRPQVAITNAKGKTLDTVVNAVSAKIAKAAIDPTAKVGPELANPKIWEQPAPGSKLEDNLQKEAIAVKTKDSLRQKATDFAKKLLSKTSAPKDEVASTKSAGGEKNSKSPNPPPVDPPKPPSGGKGEPGGNGKDKV